MSIEKANSTSIHQNAFNLFASNITAILQSKRIEHFANILNLSSHLPVLSTAVLLDLHKQCLSAKRPVEKSIISQFSIMQSISNEIVYRYLVGLPRYENLRNLKLFLEEFYPDDILNHYIKTARLYVFVEPIAHQYFENWFIHQSKYTALLSEIANIHTQSCLKSSAFQEACQRACLPHNQFNISFGIGNAHFSNMVITFPKKNLLSDDFLETGFSDFISNYCCDGFVRRIGIFEKATESGVFASEVKAGSDFSTAARLADDHIRYFCSGSVIKHPIQFYFADEMSFMQSFEHVGCSAGLSFGWLSDVYRNSIDNRLSPYIAFCGTLTGSNDIVPVSNFSTKVRIALASGIRIMVVPKKNKCDLKTDNSIPSEALRDIHFITYPSGPLFSVVQHIRVPLQKLHRDLLPPREALYWSDIVSESHRHTSPLLVRSMNDVRYSNELFSARDKVMHHFIDFLKESEYNCMALVGGSGTGKTYLLCYLCNEQIFNENIVLFIDSMSFSSDKTLNDIILDIVPGNLKPNLSFADCIRVLNDTARYFGKYLIISIDAINNARIGAREALIAIDNLLVELQRTSSDRVRIFFTCRSEAWDRLSPGNSDIPLSIERYYDSKRNGIAVELGIFSDSERDIALYKRFGDRSKALSYSSRSMLRDPFLLGLTQQVYKDSELPQDIFSWKLIDDYYSKYIPDVLSDKRRSIVELFTELILITSRDSFSRQDLQSRELHSNNLQLSDLSSRDICIKLSNLIDTDDFQRLCDDGVFRYVSTGHSLKLENPDMIDASKIDATAGSDVIKHIGFPHERFTELHIAKKLISLCNDKIYPDFVIKHFERALDFAPLWGALRLCLIRNWDAGLIASLAEKRDPHLNELLLQAFIAVNQTKDRLALMSEYSVKDSSYKL